MNAAVRREEERLFRGTVGAAGPPAVPPRGARRGRALPGVPVKAEARPDEIPQAGTTAGRGRVARTSAEIERERRKKG
ncbi:hypothetical protein HYS54_00800 [Candidatus Micrarchaeota archaeon]|nr:hypothetical protein [Candidatus Micrarchaeota archaeon]